jgi:hypothetical protein
MVPDFMTAANKLIAHLKQHQQQPGQQEQQQQQRVQLAVHAGALLRLWSCMAHFFREQGVMAVLPTIGPAAELALQVLTGPQGGLAPYISSTTFVEVRQRPIGAMLLIGICVSACDDAVNASVAGRAGPSSASRAPNQEEAVVVSDTVQLAMILHCAVLIHAARQQQRKQRAKSGSSSSSSSRWAPAEAKHLLQQLSFPLELVQHYADVACKIPTRGRAPPNADTLVEGMIAGLHHLQRAVHLRILALQHPEWVGRYSRVMAAAAEAAAGTAAAAAHLFGSLEPDIGEHMLCQGVRPLQLAFLHLKFICIMGVTQDRLMTAVAALSLIPQLLSSAQVQVVTGTTAIEPADMQRYAHSCLECVWLGLGKQLQQASGVAEAELEGDGSSQAAAAAGGDEYSSRWLDSASTLGGGELHLPADAAGRLQMVWEVYSKCLFESTALYEGGC